MGCLFYLPTEAPTHLLEGVDNVCGTREISHRFSGCFFSENVSVLIGQRDERWCLDDGVDDTDDPILKLHRDRIKCVRPLVPRREPRVRVRAPKERLTFAPVVIYSVSNSNYIKTGRLDPLRQKPASDDKTQAR